MNEKTTGKSTYPIIMRPYGSDGISCIDNERGLSCIDCSLEWLRAERVDEDE